MIEAFATTLAALVAMQLSPGPNLFAVAAAALGGGRAAALAVVAGIATGAMVWVALMAFGLGALLEADPRLLTAMKLLGGSYLLYLGVRGLLSAWRGAAVPMGAGEGAARPLAAHWRHGLLVVLTNPKVALGWAATASFLFGSGLSGMEVLLFAPIAAASALAVYGGYALLFSTGAAARLYGRFWRGADAAFGLAFGALGGALLLSGLRDLSR